jgi:hypothetical protein
MNDYSSPAPDVSISAREPSPIAPIVRRLLWCLSRNVVPGLTPSGYDLTQSRVSADGLVEEDAPYYAN